MFLLLGIGCLLFVYLACKYDEFGWVGVVFGLGAIAAFIAWLCGAGKAFEGGYEWLGYLIAFSPFIIFICILVSAPISDKAEQKKQEESRKNGKEHAIHINKNIEHKQFIGRKDIYGVYIEDGVTEIGLGAFSQCKYLKYLRIPSSVKRVGGLQGCRIEELEIGGYLDCDISLDRCCLSYSAKQELFNHLKTMPIKKPFYYNSYSFYETPYYNPAWKSKAHQERFDRFDRTRTIYCNPTYFKPTEEETILLAEKGWRVFESAPSQFLT